jgi:transcriptional regulator with XRE-family HTH domain
MDRQTSNPRQPHRWGGVENLTVDVTTAEFASRVGRFLRDVRRERGVRIRHLSDRDLSSGTLRDVERGNHDLSPMLVNELAGRYGAELDNLLPKREPILLMATGTIATGGRDESFEPNNVALLLEAYLRLIRQLRGANPDDVITLRREDMIEIADQLERPRPEIVDRVSVLLGATGAQRRAMMELYLSGASVVGVTS